MKDQEMQKLSYHIVSEYYKNNLKPYFEYIDDDVLWIGPAEKQILRTKKAILNAWANEAPNLSFTMGNFSAFSIPLGKKYCNVILRFPVYTHYPDGETQTHNQRMDFLWAERKVKAENGETQFLPRIVKIHISNATRLDDQDFIYAVHSKGLYTGQSVVPTGKSIFFRGLNGSIYYFFSDSIIFIENINYGRHTVVHTASESIPAIEKTDYFLENYPEVFLAPHTSYIVNPLHVRSVRRFSLTLDNDRTLPIPEKSYTAFKSALSEKLKHMQ